MIGAAEYTIRHKDPTAIRGVILVLPNSNDTGIAAATAIFLSYSGFSATGKAGTALPWQSMDVYKLKLKTSVVLPRFSCAMKRQSVVFHRHEPCSFVVIMYGQQYAAAQQLRVAIGP